MTTVKDVLRVSMVMPSVLRTVGSVSAISVVLHHVMIGQVCVTVSPGSQVTYVTGVRRVTLALAAVWDAVGVNVPLLPCVALATLSHTAASATRGLEADTASDVCQDSGITAHPAARNVIVQRRIVTCTQETVFPRPRKSASVISTAMRVFGI